jgi:NAD-dependent SIR2 family protein deacetylase
MPESHSSNIAPSSEQLDQIVDLLEQADGLIVAAGAGMGVDSGLPDFRGQRGFWKAYPALAPMRLDFASVASPRTFHEEPALAWGFYGHRLNLYRQTEPHAGFTMLRKWGEQLPKGYRVWTSNVDGQFQKAGFSEDRVYECHGSIHYLQCLRPCTNDIWNAEAFLPDVDENQCLLRGAMPRCPHCGRLARPNVLMFGDGDWLEARANRQAARLDAWLSTVRRPLVIELGAGTAIPSVRHFSHRIIHEYGGRLIRINPREFAVPTSYDVGLNIDALAALSAIANRLDMPG